MDKLETLMLNVAPKMYKTIFREQQPDHKILELQIAAASFARSKTPVSIQVSLPVLLTLWVHHFFCIDFKDRRIYISSNRQLKHNEFIII